MKGRRFYLPAAAAVLLGLIILSTGVFQAATTLIDWRGHLLTVEVRTNPTDPAIQGLHLIDRSPLGDVTDEPILSTHDTVLDIGPNLALNPVDGEPVVVWSRDDGADMELALARRLPGGGWTSIDLLTSNTTSDIEPRLAIDGDGQAFVLWWPEGVGGPVQIQTFDAITGIPQEEEPERPFEPPVWRNTRPGPRPRSGENSGGGSDDPGIITAEAYPCPTNPEAQPEHGIVLSCGQPAAYQLSGCQLIVGTTDAVSNLWMQTYADLSEVSLEGTSTWEIVRGMADSRCQ